MRVSKRIVAEQFVPTSTTPPSDVGIYRVNRRALGVTGRIDMFDPDTKVQSSVPVALLQCGIPFAILPGDGGSNGLSFSGTRGVFSLSAASPLANSWSMFSTGGYIYLPANAGGLATAGWYWCVMTSDTAGEVFNNVHVPSSGKPVFVSSPTQFANLTPGRITQVTTEITAVSFVMPGGSMGPNGIMRVLAHMVANNGATVKSFACKVANTLVFKTSLQTTTSVLQVEANRQNTGVETHQIGCRIATSLSGWTAGTGGTSYFAGDDTAINTKNDCTVVFTMQHGANTEGSILVPMKFSVEYGA